MTQCSLTFMDEIFYRRPRKMTHRLLCDRKAFVNLDIGNKRSFGN